MASALPDASERRGSAAGADRRRQYPAAGVAGRRVDGCDLAESAADRQLVRSMH
jgi:hypothetical protein